MWKPYKSIYANTISLFIIIIGIFVIANTQRQRYPDVIQNKLTAIITNPTLSNEDIHDKIIKSIDERLQPITFITQYHTTTYKQFAIIDITLKSDNSKMDIMKNKVRSIISTSSMPEKTDIHFWDWVISDESILDIALYSNTLDESSLKEHALDLEEYIKRNKDITYVEKLGYFYPSITITLDPTKVRNRHLNELSVIQQIQMNLNDYDGAFYEQNGQKIVLEIGQKNLTQDLVSQVSIMSPTGPVALKDIALVESGFEDDNSIYHIDGKKSIIQKIRKKPEADLIKVVDSLKISLKSYSEKNPDVSLKYIRDTSEETKNRLNAILGNLVMGFVLIVIVLLFFIHLRSALWVLYSMIISIFMSFIIFDFLDITINAISLVGIIIVSGMLIDNAIVIVENTHRFKLKGLPWKEASHNALQQVLMPLISSFLTTVMAFIPLYYLKGEVGKWAQQIPLVVIIVLAASLLQSIFLLPNHLGSQKDKKNKHLKERRLMTRLNRLYEKALRKTLFYPKTLFITSTLLIIISIYYMFVMKPFVSYPDEGSYRFTLSGSIKDSTSNKNTFDNIQKVEQFINNYPQTIMYSSYLVIGGKEGYKHFSFDCQLVEASKRKQTTDDIIAEITHVMNENPNIVNINSEKDVGGLPEKTDFVVKVLTNNPQKMTEVIEKVDDFLSKNNNIKQIIRDNLSPQTNVTFTPNYPKILASSLNINDITDYLKYYLHPQIIYSKKDVNKEPILIKASISHENDTHLENILVYNNKGQSFPLNALGTLTQVETNDIIIEENGKKLRTFYVGVKDFFALAKLYQEFQAEFGQYMNNTESDLSIEIDGKLKENLEIFESIQQTALVAFLGILIILIFTFGNVGRSIIISLAIPFSMIGVAFSLLIHNIPLSYMALFGMIGIWGVVVNNSIILVNIISENRNQKNYQELTNAIIHACRNRFRPILITSVTTIAGLFPTAYKMGGKDYFIVPTAIVMSWGLLISTLIVLFLIPTLYHAYYDKKDNK